MACPYFYPKAQLEMDAWAVSPRLPLLDAYTGECRAGNMSFEPDETTLLRFCNVGYGRGCCGRFPNEARADAVRFNVQIETATLIQIQYTFERDCWPGEHGALECSLATEGLSSGIANDILARQIAAFVESYRRRSGR